MLTRRLTLIPCLALLLAVPASAEVSAILDSKGSLERLEVRPDPLSSQIWAKLSVIPEQLVLNPLGDAFQDGPPTCGILSLPEDDPARDHVTGAGGSPGSGGQFSSGPRSAVVAWSRFDGHDFEILYSVWDPKILAWRAPAYVERADNLVDDVAPYLTMENDRAYLVWRKGSYVYASVGNPILLGVTPEIDWSVPIRVEPGTVVDNLDLFAVAVEHGVAEATGGRRR